MFMDKDNETYLFHCGNALSEDILGSYRIYGDFIFKLEPLRESDNPKLFTDFKNFGRLIAEGNTKGGLRTCFTHDHYMMRSDIYLMDCVGNLSENRLTDLKDKFVLLFEKQNNLKIKVERSSDRKSRDSSHPCIDKRVITSGKIRAIMLGVLEAHRGVKKSICMQKMIQTEPLKFQLGFVLLASTLIELFYYNHVRIKHTGSERGYGLFFNGVNSSKDKYACCGVNFPTRSLVTKALCPLDVKKDMSVDTGKGILGLPYCINSSVHDDGETNCQVQASACIKLQIFGQEVGGDFLVILDQISVEVSMVKTIKRMRNDEELLWNYPVYLFKKQKIIA